jgi:hypothetical protein
VHSGMLPIAISAASSTRAHPAKDRMSAVGSVGTT